MVKLFHGACAADDAMEPLSRTTEAIAVGQEDECVFPADEFTAHLEYRPMGVNGTTLFEQIHRDLGGVDDHNGLSESNDGADPTSIEGEMMREKK
jgi:hypothetical protein